MTIASSTPARALETSEWRNRQTLTVERAGVVTAALPPESLDAARPNLEDLRLIDASGREVPYLLVRPERPGSARLRPRTFRTNVTATNTQIVLEPGTNRDLEQILLETPAPEFLKRAQVELSPNGTDWTKQTDGVPLFRQSGVDQLALPGASAAFIRITLDDTHSAPIPITGATIVLSPAAAPGSRPLPAARMKQRDEFAGETVLTLDLGAAHVTLASLTFTTPEPLFTRPVSVTVRELQDDTAVERRLAGGILYRIAVDGAAPAERLELPVETVTPSREVLVHIANGDSPPLALTDVQVSYWPVQVTFHAPSAGEYQVLIGHATSAAPRYDVATLGGALKDAAVSVATVGPLVANPAYRQPETLAETPLLGAAIDPAPWRYRKTVQVETRGVQQLELDLDVLAHAQRHYADLRLVREGTQIPYLLERPALSRALDLALGAADDAKRPQVSRWEAKLPRPGVPLTHISLSSPTRLFQRHVRVFEWIEDERRGRYERTLASGSWSRAPGQTVYDLVLPLSSPPTGDTLVFETDNGDNPPIVLTGARATYSVVRLLFKTENGSLALYYGNPQASTARYDLALVAAQILAAEKHLATLGPEETAQADGWARTVLGRARGGIVFWTALALVVVVLLVVVAKLLPKPSTPPAGPVG